ncbi:MULTISPECIES: selenocysteine-specific translation elongation factor [unclassified Caballeronia]|uniref:selenocysteine-specific translation elongation factor n=1 Tax=unclassified Caballeronia TaxID=2646786 RepID=UPI002863FE85|nr:MULTISPECIES: selenocysteine-specific translation elongation factor [unclassified Caballeronia]MDR5739193.1 selenocysteine-specific translation elongation factor [Caballeronia sp. LZ016]MDR5807682.1 selenocysteine-specific translation elongation factor [Caballeronia sp. LZ019]
MIVGTAGHIDHGKTTLVRALSGVDTDRLKEEKARGISIELGYAYVPLAGGGMLGFIDVPGHEKLVHTMAAGACGIDFALLVIAADDGVMPQTREHLAILQLLGVTRGAVAVTKTDRVDVARVREVHTQIRLLLAGTPLHDAPFFDTDATAANDAGVAALDTHLRDAAAHWAMRRDDGFFRLAVDRVFTLSGQGTIATGTVFAGRVTVGDMLALAPRPNSSEPVRVRGIHAQNRAAQSGRAGERCALNLAGIDKDALSRGDWIVDGRIARASERIDVDLTLLADAGITLTHWAPLHVHLGTTHRVAHVALLDGDTLAAGQAARVQLVFEQPVCALPGDRFIARNAQASRTVGGGRVLDPFAPARKRRTPQRRAWLDALADWLDTARADALFHESPYGLPRSLVEHLCGMPAESVALPEGLRRVPLHDDALLIAAAHWNALAARLTDALAAFHERFPDEQGPDAARLRRMAAPLAPDALWRAIIDDAVASGAIARSGPWLHLPSHTVALDAAEEALAGAVLASIERGRFDPPWMRDLAREHGADEDAMRRLLRKLARRGDLFQIVRDLFYSRASIAELARLAAQNARSRDGAADAIGAAEFRDATGLGRKRAIQVLEFFDRVGYTRFHRDLHLLRADSRWHESA